MAKHTVYSAADVGFNMTPMIDCTFQLIIFFMLASQVAGDAYASNVMLIRPLDSQAIPIAVASFPNKVTVNVVSAAAGEQNPDPEMAAGVRFYKINQVKFNVGEWDRMADVIKKQRTDYDKQFGASRAPSASASGKEGEDDRQFFLEIRADRRVKWENMAPVIRAGVEAGISKLNITALTARGDEVN
jgi:biopolymer transport protein ExbD